MDRCNELCTKDTAGYCALCETLAERDQFIRLWFQGGLLFDGVRVLKGKGVFTFLRRYAFFFISLGVVLLAVLFVSRGWDSNVANFLNEHHRFFAVLIAGLIVAILWFIWKVPQWQVATLSDVKERIDLESKSRQTLAQIVGGGALLAGLYFTSQTLQTTQEGQITERFTKAIDQLGKDTIAVRLGGIYALERIARDSTKDYWQIMEVLTAFVREHSPRKEEQAPQQEEIQAIPLPKHRQIPPQGSSDPLSQPLVSPPIDVMIIPTILRPSRKLSTEIQAVLTVLVRRRLTFGQGKEQRLDLSQTDLRAANLKAGNLRRIDLGRADLREASLEGADLSEARLDGAWLNKAIFVNANLRRAFLTEANCKETEFAGANLTNAQLYKADLRKARLYDTTLIRADLRHADLRDASLGSADVTDAKFQKTDLRGAFLEHIRGLTHSQVESAVTDETTRLPAFLKAPADKK